MNLKVVLPYLGLILMSLSFVQCTKVTSTQHLSSITNKSENANLPETSKLPQKMPATFSISYNKNDGRIVAMKTIEINGRDLSFFDFKGPGEKFEKWSSKISSEDLEGLYRIFVENKFDLIKNDAADSVINDAGSETVVLKINGETAGIDQNTLYKIRYGLDAPLSGDSLDHFQTVAAAINNLAAKYKKT